MSYSEFLADEYKFQAYKKFMLEMNYEVTDQDVYDFYNLNPDLIG